MARARSLVQPHWPVGAQNSALSARQEQQVQWRHLGELREERRYALTCIELSWLGRVNMR